MLISEVQAHLGEEWYVTDGIGGRARLDAIEPVVETDYYSRRERKVRYVRVTWLDHETGKPRVVGTGDEAIPAGTTLVAARTIEEPWVDFWARHCADERERVALDRLYSRAHELLTQAGFEVNDGARKPVITLSRRLSLSIPAAEAILGLLDRVGADEEG